MTRLISYSIALFLLVGLLAALCTAAEESDGNKNAPIKPKNGFIRVPAGQVEPGCTVKDWKARADDAVKAPLYAYEVWGGHKDYQSVTLPAYLLQQFEMTNAQWKLYLDRAGFVVKVTTNGQQTLEALARQYIQFQDEPIPGQWGSIYALNWKTIYEAVKQANQWDPAWKPESPGDKLKDIFLPKDLELTFYKCPVPKHWYGWCNQSGLRDNQEYVDITKAPLEAFLVPDDEMFKGLKPPLRKAPQQKVLDYKNYPIRDLAAREAMAMAEWAGCSLPTEYELERAMRGSAPRSKTHTGATPWDRRKQQARYAFAENPAVAHGPLPVDDPSVAEGDSEFGFRHLLGNVWEFTSTFWDLHPYLEPRPDTEPSLGMFNFALVVKGGAWGSGYRDLQISTRTGMFSAATTFDLRAINRADSVGLRLARHEQPGYDLVGHSMRRLSFDSRLGTWKRKPHEFAFPRATGADVTHFVDSSADDGYCFIQEKARTVAFLPTWRVLMSKTDLAKHKVMQRPAGEAYYLGILRTDLPFRAGQLVPPADYAALQKARKEYAKKVKEIEAANKKKKKGEALQELPEAPAAPDEYEKYTEKFQKQCGIWRGATIAAGEYHVVYWYGFVALLSRAELMPPVAILMPESIRAERKIDSGKGSTVLDLDKGVVKLQFDVEEWDGKGKDTPPGPSNSDLWALCQTLEYGWPGRKVNKAGYRFKVDLAVSKEELNKYKWNTETPPAEDN